MVEPRGLGHHRSLDRQCDVDDRALCLACRAGDVLGYGPPAVFRLLLPGDAAVRSVNGKTAEGGRDTGANRPPRAAARSIGLTVRGAPKTPRRHWPSPPLCSGSAGTASDQARPMADGNPGIPP